MSVKEKNFWQIILANYPKKERDRLELLAIKFMDKEHT